MVDVYTKVWGPCLMLDTYFYNTYFGAPRGPEGRFRPTACDRTRCLCVADLNDAGMGVKFVRACSDKITELMEFRDNACPYFVFYMARG